MLAAMLLTAATVIATTTPTIDPVADCPPGLVCFTLDEFQAINDKVIDLKADAALAKVKHLKRFGFSIGCGVVGYEAEDGGKGDFDYAPGCAAVYGFRFK
jgi:hypothetical protein